MWQGGDASDAACVIQQVTSEGGQAWSRGEGSPALWAEGHSSTSSLRPRGKPLPGPDTLALRAGLAQGLSSICPQRQQKQTLPVDLCLVILSGFPLEGEAHLLVLRHPEMEREALLLMQGGPPVYSLLEARQGTCLLPRALACPGLPRPQPPGSAHSPGASGTGCRPSLHQCATRQAQLAAISI